MLEKRRGFAELFVGGLEKLFKHQVSSSKHQTPSAKHQVSKQIAVWLSWGSWFLDLVEPCPDPSNTAALPDCEKLKASLVGENWQCGNKYCDEELGK